MSLTQHDHDQEFHRIVSAHAGDVKKDLAKYHQHESACFQVEDDRLELQLSLLVNASDFDSWESPETGHREWVVFNPLAHPDADFLPVYRTGDGEMEWVFRAVIGPDPFRPGSVEHDHWLVVKCRPERLWMGSNSNVRRVARTTGTAARRDDTKHRLLLVPEAFLVFTEDDADDACQAAGAWRAELRADYLSFTPNVLEFLGEKLGSGLGADPASIVERRIMADYERHAAESAEQADEFEGLLVSLLDEEALGW